MLSASCDLFTPSFILRVFLGHMITLLRMNRWLIRFFALCLAVWNAPSTNSAHRRESHRESWAVESRRSSPRMHLDRRSEQTAEHNWFLEKRWGRDRERTPRSAVGGWDVSSQTCVSASWFHYFIHSWCVYRYSMSPNPRCAVLSDDSIAYMCVHPDLHKHIFIYMKCYFRSSLCRAAWGIQSSLLCFKKVGLVLDLTLKSLQIK